MRDALYVVGGLAIIAFFVVRQRRSQRFEQRSLIIPAARKAWTLGCHRFALPLTIVLNPHRDSLSAVGRQSCAQDARRIPLLSSGGRAPRRLPAERRLRARARRAVAVSACG
jgi:hypothetical protein